MRKATLMLMILMLTATVWGCRDETLTREEAKLALDEAQLSTQSQSMTYDVLEISTHFTIGAAVEDAVDELKAFVESQIPCSTVTRQDRTLTVDFGELGDQCVYKGRTYAGQSQITLERTEAGQLEVTHVWTDLTNGNVTINGGATVTWDRSEGTRRVEHQIKWSNGDKSATGEGDRTQQLIDRDLGLQGGIEINGSRGWSSDRGQWNLAIKGVQVRGADPVPQAGTYTLTNPDNKELTMSFKRLDDTTIEVQVSGTRRDFTFNVRAR